MSKFAENICTPVPIHCEEQTANEYLKTVEGSDIKMPTIILVENLSGQPLKLVDQQCAFGKWIYGPGPKLADGHSMVLLVGQPPLSLSGVGACISFTAPDLAVSCCAETTVMGEARSAGFISETEERIAGTIFAEALNTASPVSHDGKAKFADLVLEWGGTADIRYFTLYPAAKEELIMKWRKINESEIEPASVISNSSGSILNMITLHHGSLYRFLEATLSGALMDLNYAEDQEEATEILEDLVSRDLRQSVVGVWNDFDKEGKGSLDEEQCYQLMNQFFAIFVHESPTIIGRLLVQQNLEPQHYSFKLADDSVDKLKEIVGKLEVKELSRELFRDMWNVEGQVAKQDFINALLAQMQRLLQPVKQVVLDNKVTEDKMDLEQEQQTGKKREKPSRPWKDAMKRRCECF